jgi:signal transduction histidine kinase
MMSIAPPLAPFRWLAFAIGIFNSLDEIRDGKIVYILSALVLGGYNIWVTVRPIPYEDNERVRLFVVLEFFLVVAITLVTGFWDSPFVFALVPTTLLAGFTGGTVFAMQLAAGAAMLITLRFLTVEGFAQGIGDTGIWTALLGLVALTSGLSRRLSEDSADLQKAAFDRLSKLTEANSLLFALQRVAQTLPASLDLDEVLDSMVTRMKGMVDADVIAVALYDGPSNSWEIARAKGFRPHSTVLNDGLPSPARLAVDSSRAILARELGFDRPGLWEDARCAVYGPLRARDALIGVLAVESRTPNGLGPKEVEIIHNFAESFGVAIDNARLFRHLRSLGADEERTRIARDLHDRVGNSLASIGFEVEMAATSAARGDDVGEMLGSLRGQVKATVTEVREALYDLRTNVSESADIVETLNGYLRRVQNRSGIETNLVARATSRLPLIQEREFFNIAREAVSNAERHSNATAIVVRWQCDGRRASLEIEDNGCGFAPGSGRNDSYGLVGMRERASSMGAEMKIESEQDRGTRVRASLNGGQ